jgi:hypothetical protein
VIVTYRDASKRDLAAASRTGVASLVPESHGLGAVFAVLRRGRRHSGRSSRAGLTDREVELIALLGSGHSVPESPSSWGSARSRAEPQTPRLRQAGREEQCARRRQGSHVRHARSTAASAGARPADGERQPPGADPDLSQLGSSARRGGMRRRRRPGAVRLRASSAAGGRRQLAAVEPGSGRTGPGRPRCRRAGRRGGPRYARHFFTVPRRPGFDNVDVPGGSTQPKLQFAAPQPRVPVH